VFAADRTFSWAALLLRSPSTAADSVAMSLRMDWTSDSTNLAILSICALV
jgi:hypothetical protein